MAYSIYENFLTVADCKYYCNQLANKLNLSSYDYFYDKSSDIKFPGDSDITKFKLFQEYESWRIKFNLTKPKTIQELGLEEYVSKHKELRFNLTIKGLSFLYICKFSSPIQENVTINPIFIIEPSGQVALNLN